MNLHAEWITGFVDGEGCFRVAIRTHSETAAGCQIQPEFTVVQHERDVQILYALKDYFGCGVVRVNHGDQMVYRVRKITNLVENIVPFFMKHPLKSKKNVAFRKFRKVVLKMAKGDHLTRDGVEEIRLIANQMNVGNLR